MILSKRRDKRIDGIIESLTLLRSEKGIERILREFKNNEDTRNVENRINRAFLFCLREVMRKYNIAAKDEQHIPPEMDMPYHPSEEKRPDFSLELNDDLNETVSFHIECKRLGSATSSRTYNTLYVKEGLYRFTSDEYRYGIHSASGVMIGYIENMKFETIFKNVNKVIDSELGVDNLTKQSTDWQEKSTTHLKHSFERNFKKSPFILHHFWIDLIDCYPPTNQTKPVHKQNQSP